MPIQIMQKGIGNSITQGILREGLSHQDSIVTVLSNIPLPDTLSIDYPSCSHPTWTWTWSFFLK